MPLIGQGHGELNDYNGSWRASSMKGAIDGLGWTTVPHEKWSWKLAVRENPPRDLRLKEQIRLSTLC